MTEIRPITACRALCFAPHPDDEIIGPGGSLHLIGAAGGAVHVALATDGQHGDPDGKFAAESYCERRREESRRAMAALGLAPSLSFWGLPDSSCAREEDLVRLTDLVVKEIEQFQPDVVYLPWEGDNNSDHQILHEVVVRGLSQLEFQGEALGYEVWAPIPRPDYVVDITAIVEVKRGALLCHETQFAYGDVAHPLLGLSAYRSLLLERSGGFGEAFARVEF